MSTSDTARQLDEPPRPYYFSCPKCGNRMEMRRPNEAPDNLGCALLLLGGITPALLYSSHAGNRAQCGRCHYIFQRPGFPISLRAAAGGAVVISILLLIVLPILYASMFSDLEDAGALAAMVRSLVKRVREQSMLTIILIVGGIFFAFVYGLKVWIVETIRHRARVRRDFRVYPE